MSDSPGIREQNDQLILNALDTLRDPVKRTKLKLKITVPAMCKLTNLTPNTIRSRTWATQALKEMKAAAKRKATDADDATAGEKTLPAVNLVDSLRERVAVLLEQNSLLFDEVLLLREQVKVRELRIEELQGKRLAAV